MTNLLSEKKLEGLMLGRNEISSKSLLDLSFLGSLHVLGIHSGWTESSLSGKCILNQTGREMFSAANY